MSVRENLAVVLASIKQAAHSAQRQAEGITLVAVSKKKPTVLMREYIEAAQEQGIRVVFGENYVQELKQKRAELGEGVELHLIGPLQSNKIRDAVKFADVIQSVHSMAVLEEIVREAQARAKRQRIFLQVNIGNDPAKSGWTAGDIPEVLKCIPGYSDSIDVVGLMTITPWYDQPELARPEFMKMSQLRADLIRQGYAHHFADSHIYLSMGMSADFDIAIAEGADYVRVGTALFGER
jgi:pyridoxal phosphate enzyme (YggS family)